MPSSSRWRIVEASGVDATPWRNGGGVTRELLHLPGPASADAPRQDDWMVRVSVADITADGPFSSFPGIERGFAVLSGAGVALSFADDTHERGEPSRCRVDVVTPASEALRFDGARPPGCRLLDGPTRDLNVMARGDLAHAGLARAQWNVPWEPHVAASPPAAGAALGAGLFAAAPLALRAGAGPARLVPAQTLVWCEHPEPCAWTIVPAGRRASAKAQTASTGAPPGWWIVVTSVRLPAC
jgi:environmental stress-induced protein Ves